MIFSSRSDPRFHAYGACGADGVMLEIDVDVEVMGDVTIIVAIAEDEEVTEVMHGDVKVVVKL
jgi:hypothetical protein